MIPDLATQIAATLNISEMSANIGLVGAFSLGVAGIILGWRKIISMAR